MIESDNKYTNVKRAASGDKDFLIIEKQDFFGIPLKADEAEYVCRTLALYLGLSIVDQRENIRVLNEKANQNDLKEDYLGSQNGTF